MDKVHIVVGMIEGEGAAVLGIYKKPEKAQAYKLALEDANDLPKIHYVVEEWDVVE